MMPKLKEVNPDSYEAKARNLLAKARELDRLRTKAAEAARKWKEAEREYNHYLSQFGDQK
jgi:hypothetical protein